MVSVVLLSVAAITCTSVLARPSDIDSKTKRSAEEDSRELFTPSKIQFPTEIRDGFTVTINGTMNTSSNMLEVIFPSDSKIEEHDCKIIFDFVNEIVDVSPSPDDESNKSDYKIAGDWKQPGEYPTFSITLRATAAGDSHIFMMTFEANGSGPSPISNCKIHTKFDDFKSIEFRNGVHSITSILFAFQ